jgi:hypothetical protein
MKKLSRRVMIAASVGTVPVLILLALWTFITEKYSNMPNFHAIQLGLLGAPFLFPFVVAGTAISCCRSVPMKMRPLAIALGITSVGAIDLVIAYWCYILTHGFMG